MFLGIEIGGTKLQLGVGTGDGSPFVALERRDVERQRGAEGILEQIAESGRKLIDAHQVTRVGFGFGGPVSSAEGKVVTSHQISGWDGLPLVEWCRETLGLPAVLGNDCDSAALAEARFGAGRGKQIVFFVTVGTGIGGGLVIDGRLHGSGRPAVAEIGHLRPGLNAVDSHATVESLASGPGIENAARRRIGESESSDRVEIDDLLQRCDGDLELLTAKMIAEAAMDENGLARSVLNESCRTLGWAIAQVATLVSPEVVVIGGGVSLIGEEYFFEPVRAAFREYVFPQLKNSCEIVPAGLGEEVVVHGALALAAEG